MKFALKLSLTCALGAWLMSSAAAQELTIENDQFVYGGQLIPAGCIAQLSPQLNGDQLIASVFLQRPSYRGCMAANFPYPQQEAGAKPPTYEIVHKLTDSVYWVMPVPIPPRHTRKAAQAADQFERRDYHAKDGAKSFLGLWYRRVVGADLGNAKEAFDTEQRVLIFASTTVASRAINA